MEELMIFVGQIIFFVVLFVFAVGILYVFYEEYNLKYEMRKEQEFKDNNGVYTDDYKGWISHTVIADKVIEIEDNRYELTGHHSVPEMYTLICGWLASLNTCSRYDISDHIKVMDIVREKRNERSKTGENEVREV
jgi:hypothetical protein